MSKQIFGPNICLQKHHEINVILLNRRTHLNFPYIIFYSLYCQNNTNNICPSHVLVVK